MAAGPMTATTGVGSAGATAEATVGDGSAPDGAVTTGDATTEGAMTPGQAVLDVDDVVVTFDTEAGPITAVDGVSLQLAQGETLGLVGESGCGKSTLARAVMQLVAPVRGSVHLEGVELRSLTARELRRLRHRIQMVFQDPRGSLDPRMSIATLIGEPLRVHKIGNSATRNRTVTETMEMVGLPASLADRLPSELSGGQQQRVCIARSIVTRPAVLVCDEPVSALDVSIQAQIINVLDEMQAELQLAILFISHDLSVVRHLSDRVAVMYLGQIVETGTTDQVFAAPRHPYTQGLITAVPRADSESAARLRTARRLVRGELPSLLDPPSGCRYRTRCPYADHQCAEEVPIPEAPLHSTETAPNSSGQRSHADASPLSVTLHSVRCHHWRDIATQARAEHSPADSAGADSLGPGDASHTPSHEEDQR